MNDQAFFATVRNHLFGGTLKQGQVDGLNVLLVAGVDLILPQRAYMLATAFHETAATIQPIAEYGRGVGHPYGVVDQTGKAPYGRGFCQLTWRYNYVNADIKLGLGGKLASNYDLALQPDIAAMVIEQGMVSGWFTGRKLSTYINATSMDFINARRIINGLDRAQLIAGYANIFLSALKGATA